jgi:hypothetical protein
MGAYLNDVLRFRVQRLWRDLRQTASDYRGSIGCSVAILSVVATKGMILLYGPAVLIAAGIARLVFVKKTKDFLSNLFPHDADRIPPPPWRMSSHKNGYFDAGSAAAPCYRAVLLPTDFDGSKAAQDVLRSGIVSGAWRGDTLAKRARAVEQWRAGVAALDAPDGEARALKERAETAARSEDGIGEAARLLREYNVRTKEDFWSVPSKRATGLLEAEALLLSSPPDFDRAAKRYRQAADIEEGRNVFYARKRADIHLEAAMAKGSARNLSAAVSDYRELLRYYAAENMSQERAQIRHCLGDALSLSELHDNQDDPDSNEKRMRGWEEAVVCYRAAAAEEGCDARQRIATHNNLGNILLKISRMREAADAYRCALTDCPRERLPLQWAALQHQLGTALAAIGEREALREAASAYRCALTERRREIVPADWRETQKRLESVLWKIADAEKDAAEPLEEAVRILAALTTDPGAEPQEKAEECNNLGTALRRLGALRRDPKRTEEAIHAYETALKEFERLRFPLHWAATKDNLGAALQSLGEQESGTERLNQAAEAYRATAAKQRRGLDPSHWADSRCRLGATLFALWEREGEPERLKESVAAYRDALKECRRPSAPAEWAEAQCGLGTALLALCRREGGDAMRNEARMALADAHRIFSSRDDARSAYIKRALAATPGPVASMEGEAKAILAVCLCLTIAAAFFGPEFLAAAWKKHQPPVPHLLLLSLENSPYRTNSPHIAEWAAQNNQAELSRALEIAPEYVKQTLAALDADNVPKAQQGERLVHIAARVKEFRDFVRSAPLLMRRSDSPDVWLKAKANAALLRDETEKAAELYGKYAHSGNSEYDGQRETAERAEGEFLQMRAIFLMPDPDFDRVASYYEREARRKNNPIEYASYLEKAADVYYGQGERKGDKGALKDAVRLYEDLIEKPIAPETRARLQNAVGNAFAVLALLGERECGRSRAMDFANFILRRPRAPETPCLEEAVALFRQAMTNDPGNRAIPQYNLGMALSRLAGEAGKNRTAAKEEARQAFAGAYAAFSAAGDSRAALPKAMPDMAE